MMLKILIYAYATGVFSLRRIARHIEENIAFRREPDRDAPRPSAGAPARNHARRRRLATLFKGRKH